MTYEDLVQLPTVRHWVPKPGTYGAKYEIPVKLDGSELVIYNADIGLPVSDQLYLGMENYTSKPAADFATIEMNVLDEHVARNMLRYPSTSDSRLSVLCHMFFVLGNGYHWHKTGVLIDSTGKNANTRVPIPLTSQMSEMAERLSQESPDAFGDDVMKTMVAAEVAENVARLRRQLFIDHYATLKSDTLNLAHPYYNAKSISHYYSTNNLDIASIPNNASIPYLEGAVEALKVVRAAEWERVKTMEDEAERSVLRNQIYGLDHIERTISKKIHDFRWAFVSTIANALISVGFAKRVDINCSNGSGSYMRYKPRQLNEEQIEKIAKRLSRKFDRDGLKWSREDAGVWFELVREDNVYEAKYMIISHPNDEKHRIETLRRQYEMTWEEVRARS